MELTGRVEKWKDRKGYGFIEGADGHRYWTHYSSIATGTGFAKLAPGVEVTFDYDAAGEVEDGHRRAENVRVEGEPPRVWPQPEPTANRV
jgi:cold shock CspA family protein